MAANGSHGGRRVGAGRKPSLDLMERLRLGLLCDDLQSKSVESADEAAHRLDDHAGGLHEGLRALNLSQRRQLLDLMESPLMEAPEDLDGGLLELAEDLEDFRYRRDGGGPDNYARGGRIVRRHLKPRMTRAAIIEAVVSSERQAGRIISPRLVVECWKFTRRFVRQLDESTSNGSDDD